MASVSSELLQKQRGIISSSLQRRADSERQEHMTEGIKETVIFIAGASSGLGEATARRLVAEGAKVPGVRRADRLQALAGELSKNAVNAIAIGTDVTNPAQAKTLVDVAVQTHARVDVTVNNAGLMPQALLEQLKIDEWDP
jgi:NADP-dependent 3-hydroxy acid dehydrogenase YdfG